MMDFKPLWKILIDKEMDKKDLVKEAGLTSATLTRMKQKKNVSVGTLLKISKVVGYNMEDLFIYDNDGSEE